MKKTAFSIFHQKLHELLEQAQKLIIDAKEKKPYNEGLVCLLTNTIYELEEASDKIVKETDNEDLAIDAGLVKNILEQPLYPSHQPSKKVSLLSAAKIHKETKNPSEIHDIILACALDQKHTEVMLDNLRDLSESIDEEN